MLAAIIMVDGKADPTPNGDMAIKKMIAPNAPTLNILPLSNIDIAISPWQVAISATANRIWFLNQPVIKFLYHSVTACSA